MEKLSPTSYAKALGHVYQAEPQAPMAEPQAPWPERRLPWPERRRPRLHECEARKLLLPSSNVRPTRAMNGRNAGALACMSAEHESYCYHPQMFDPREKAGRRKHSRGYLPHFDVYESTQFVTFRLADSMPQNLLKEWKAELENGEITDVDLRKRIEQYLDSGSGSCALRDRRIANLLRETLIKWNGERYELIAWVIMPNHVHILIRLLEKNLLSEIMHSIKSYTAHEANKVLARTGRFWSVESFDRYIRNADHYSNTVKYIEQNPVKAGLCKDAADWEFSSAYKLV